MGDPIAKVSADTKPDTDDTAIDFMTLGMLVIDEIEYDPARPSAKDILGGGGPYSALGARLFSPSPHLSKSISFIADRGSDFPEDMSTLLDSWDTSVYMRDDPDRLTTRGHLAYPPEGGGPRPFHFTTDKVRLKPDDLKPEQLAARSFHIFGSPARCREIVDTLTRSRRHIASVLPPGPEAEALRVQLSSRPFIIWEPSPDSCTPDELLNVTNNLRLVDVCSPNHAELAGLMGDTTLACEDPETGRGVSKEAVELACEQLLASMPLQSFSLVVRCGEAGCFVTRNGGRKRVTGGAKKKKKKAIAAHGGLQADTDMMSLFEGLMQDDRGFIAREEIEVDPGIERWFPAYHRSKEVNGHIVRTVVENGQAISAGKVLDPTGGGNAFLGGLAVALARGSTIDEAAVYGSVAASFAIEQIGLPHLSKDDEGNELWNSVRVSERLEEFKKRVGMAPQSYNDARELTVSTPEGGSRSTS